MQAPRVHSPALTKASLGFARSRDQRSKVQSPALDESLKDSHRVHTSALTRVPRGRALARSTLEVQSPPPARVDERGPSVHTPALARTRTIGDETPIPPGAVVCTPRGSVNNEYLTVRASGALGRNPSAALGRSPANLLGGFGKRCKFALKEFLLKGDHPSSKNQK